MVHKVNFCHPGGSQDRFLPREAVFKPVNCHVVKQKGRWLSLPFPAGTSLPTVWDQRLFRWKDGDVVGWEEPPRLGRAVLERDGECGRSRWMEGERHEDQAGARSGASPEKSLCYRQPRFELQKGSRFYSVLRLKLPLSLACFMLFFGSG